MKLFNQLYSLLIIIIVFSCQEKNKNSVDQNLQNIPVQIENITDHSFHEVFEVVKLFPIKNSQNQPITEILKILKIEEKIWILTSSSILITDTEGELEQTIESIGKGPLEYLKLSDIQWNPYLSLVEVLDPDQGKLIRFGQNGLVINEWKNKYLRLASSFFPNENSYWIYGGTFFNGGGNRLVKVDSQDGEKLNGQFSLGSERNHLGVIESSNFIPKNQESLFYHSYNDTIYTLQDNKFSPSYLIDFGPQRVSNELLTGDFKDIREFGQELKKKGLADFLNSLYYSNQTFFFRFFYGGKPITAIHNLNDGNTKLIENWKVKYGTNYAKLSSYSINFPIGAEGEFLYFGVDPYTIKSEIEKLKSDPNLELFLSENPNLEMIISQFETYENPYILKLRVRK